MISSINHMFARAIWDKLHECNFKIFKNHEGDLSTKLPKSNIWLLINHTKPATPCIERCNFSYNQLSDYLKNRPNQKCGYWLIIPNHQTLWIETKSDNYKNSGQLQSNSMNGEIWITMNRIFFFFFFLIVIFKLKYIFN